MRCVLPLIVGLVSATAVGQPRLVVQTGHTDLVSVADLSPDGRLLVTGGRDRTARLWEFSSGKELAMLRHDAGVTAVHFSRDGQHIITASSNANVRIFDARSGKLLDSFKDRGSTVALTPSGDRFVSAHWTKVLVVSDFPGGAIRSQFQIEDVVTSIAVSPDGATVLYGTKRGGIVMRRIGDGDVADEFTGHTDAVVSLEFSSDGSRIVSGSSDGSARIWDLNTGEARILEAHDERSNRKPGVNSATFSPDGRWVLTGQSDQTARLWSAETGSEEKTFRGHDGMFNQVLFTADGNHIVSTSHDATARLWSIESRKTVREFKGEVDEVLSVDIHPDGRTLATGSGFRSRSVSVWSLDDGSMTSRLRLDAGTIESVRYSEDGSRLAANGRPDVYVWDTRTRELRSKTNPRFGHKITGLDFAPDGRRLIVGSFDGSARIVDSSDGSMAPWRFETPSRIENQPNHLISVAWSPDGQYVLTGELVQAYKELNYAILWRQDTGEEVRQFGPLSGAIDSAEFSPDGQLLLLTSANTVWVFDVATGDPVANVPQDRPVGTSIWSDDGHRVVTAGMVVRLLDGKTGKTIRQYDGHIGNVDGIRILDNRILATVGRDGTTRLWNLETGEELARLISFNDGTWAVVDGAGRFDASSGGDVDGMHWVVSDEAGDYEVIALSQLKQRFYEPGLLSKLMGFNDEPVRDVSGIAQAGVDLSPGVTVVHTPDVANPVLRVTIENRGGGIGPVRVLINGKEVTGDARPSGSDPNAQTLQIAMDLAGSPLFLPDADNAIEIVASNADQSLTSRGGAITVARGAAPAARHAARPPRIWGVVVGVSDYRGKDIDLSFAYKDAASFAIALEVAAAGLVDASQVHIKLIGDGSEPATRAGIRQVFEYIAGQATSSDILVIYMAGHGVTWGGGSNADYYYLLADAASLDVSDRAVREQATISSQELTELIKGVPALKQVLILDTCASGQIVTDLVKPRGVSSGQMRSLERMKDRTGMYVLAGSAADAESYEASRYGQGLLTYSLLTGMRGAALREDEFVDVNKLFTHAADEVERLVGNLGGVQQPRISVPHGGSSFDIGRVSSADRARIVVATPKPIVISSNFQDEKKMRDHLKLRQGIDAAIRDAAAADGAGFVFFETPEFPDAYAMSGRYQISGEQISLRVFMSRGDSDAGEFEVSGSTADLPALAAQVIGEMQSRLTSP
jgi:WD40 repeat protein